MRGAIHTGATFLPAKVQIEHLYKIFGPSPEQAIKRLEDGVTKDSLLQETGNIVGVADASFEVEQGQIFMVMGLSGSGKSTLVRCLNRLITPTSGQVKIEGQDLMDMDDQQLRELRRTQMTMVFQHFALFPHKTVAENVEYGLKVRGIIPEQRRTKALETLELVGLDGWGNYRPENLSGGMQQRVGLARALATEAEILLMDEAFSALDPLIRREMQDELKEFQSKVRKTIVFITHDLDEALRLGDNIAIMKDGRIIQIGTPEQIVSGPADDYVAAFTQDVDRSRVYTVSTIMKDPEPLQSGQDSVSTALFRMRDLARDGLYVVDPDQKPLGVVTELDVVRAVQEGVTDLSSVMQRDFPQNVASETLAGIYDCCASGVPVAVVDDQGRLTGVVHILDLLAALAVNNVASVDEKELTIAPSEGADAAAEESSPTEMVR
ncbi:MAG: glycine betaine/L-proline ABC transporter ATP-binding protein [Dehalococcoidia bacterium]